MNILKRVSGCFEPGLHAIIGPAGSGKTLLMEVLAGLRNPCNIEGTVLVNSKKPSTDFYQKIGYVSNEDVLMKTLTVRENIEFSANLTLAESEKKKQARVESIISQLELEKCADSKVGDEWSRGVSGGERKRTNIAMEMLKQPRILFLDEPTSGLDAHMAFSVVSLLHKLSLQGRTIIFSIHQPRYSIFKLFHTLTILSHGQTVFHGPSDQALSYFASIGKNCEEHNNPSDFFMDTIMASTESDCYKIDSKEPTKKITVSTEFPNLFHDLFTKSSIFQQTFSKLKFIEESSKENKDDCEKVKEIPYATSLFTQVKVVSKRSIQNILRDPLPHITPVIINECFAVLIGLVFFNIFRKITSVQVALQNSFKHSTVAQTLRTGALYFVAANQMFNCLSDVQVLAMHQTLVIHEVKKRYYRTSAYLFSKLLTELLPFKVISVFIFSLITYFMFGVTFHLSGFMTYFYGLLVLSVTSSFFCLFVSSCFKTSGVVHLLVNFGFVTCVLFSGFFSNIASIYAWLRWLTTISFLRYGLNITFISQMKGLTMQLINGTHLYLDRHSATQRLDMLAIKHEDDFDVWSNLLALHLYACILLVATYVRLRYTPKNY